MAIFLLINLKDFQENSFDDYIVVLAISLNEEYSIDSLQFFRSWIKRLKVIGEKMQPSNGQSTTTL